MGASGGGVSWREGREVGGESERRSRIQSLGSRRRARTRFGLVSVSSERERERETDGASHRLTDTSRHGSSSVSDHRVRRRRRRPPSGPRGRLAQDGEARRVKRVERGEGESGGEEGRKGEGGGGALECRDAVRKAREAGWRTCGGSLMHGGDRWGG